MAFRRKKTGEAGKEFEKKKGRLTTIVVVFLVVYLLSTKKNTNQKERERERSRQQGSLCNTMININSYV
jgi:hypothetical protein